MLNPSRPLPVEPPWNRAQRFCALTEFADLLAQAAARDLGLSLVFLLGSAACGAVFVASRGRHPSP
jgi:hypothetical protein